VAEYIYSEAVRGAIHSMTVDVEKEVFRKAVDLQTLLEKNSIHPLIHITLSELIMLILYKKKGAV